MGKKGTKAVLLYCIVWPLLVAPNTNPRSSQFASVRCPGNGLIHCGISQPTESYSVVSPSECTVACMNIAGCNWFNFIVDVLVDVTSSGLGRCEVFTTPPKTGVQPYCTLYASVMVLSPISTPPGNKDILVQQHYGGSTFFQRSWNEFKAGFGELNSNYWIGNEQMHQLTSSGQYRLRFDLQASANCQWYWAEYSTFIVDSETTFYTLTVGGYNGTAGEAMTCNSDPMFNLNGTKFTTFDSDNDNCPTCNCAVTPTYGNPCGGGFWQRSCLRVLINTPNSCTGPLSGFTWWRLPTSDGKLMYSRMKLI